MIYHLCGCRFATLRMGLVRADSILNREDLCLHHPSPSHSVCHLSRLGEALVCAASLPLGEGFCLHHPSPSAPPTPLPGGEA